MDRKTLDFAPFSCYRVFHLLGCSLMAFVGLCDDYYSWFPNIQMDDDDGCHDLSTFSSLYSYTYSFPFFLFSIHFYPFTRGEGWVDWSVGVLGYEFFRFLDYLLCFLRRGSVGLSIYGCLTRVFGYGHWHLLCTIILILVLIVWKRELVVAFVFVFRQVLVDSSMELNSNSHEQYELIYVIPHPH